LSLPQSDSAPPPGAPTAATIAYAEGGTWPLIRRHLINVGLMIVTLGLYRFWAITIMRQILWRRIRVGGQPLEYTGAGLEIFLGFVRVFLFILLPLGIVYMLVELGLERRTPTANADAIEAVDLIYFLVVLMLIEMGRFLSWRYRISRTRWRGIRGRIEHPVSGYLRVAAASSAMIVFSGWLLKPVVDLYRAKNILATLNVGGMKGRYLGGVWALFATWIAVWFGFVFLMVMGFMAWVPLVSIAAAAGSELMVGLVMLAAGLGVFWVSIFMLSVYRVAFWRQICTLSSVGPARVRFSGTAVGMTWLTVINWLLLAISAGLLAPVTWERKIRYLAANVSIHGMPDPADLRQVAEDDSAFGGEGLAGDFDIA
jgi:uncharacterized membrane protein YjgN (DUF898 family)